MAIKHSAALITSDVLLDCVVAEWGRDTRSHNVQCHAAVNISRRGVWAVAYVLRVYHKGFNPRRPVLGLKYNTGLH